MPINIAKGTEDCQAMSNGLLNLGLEVRVLCQDPAKKKNIYKSTKSRSCFKLQCC